jgi:hypothetical protein
MVDIDPKALYAYQVSPSEISVSTAGYSLINVRREEKRREEKRREEKRREEKSESPLLNFAASEEIEGQA